MDPRFCDHNRVWKEIKPQMGKHPESHICPDCRTAVSIVWVPYFSEEYFFRPHL